MAVRRASGLRVNRRASSSTRRRRASANSGRDLLANSIELTVGAAQDPGALDDDREAGHTMPSSEIATRRERRLMLSQISNSDSSMTQVLSVLARARHPPPVSLKGMVCINQIVMVSPLYFKGA